MSQGAIWSAQWEVPPTYDLEQSLRLLSMGHRDRTLRLQPRDAKWTAMTPDGPVTVHVQHHQTHVVAAGFGSGADWVQPHVPALLGLEDRPTDFQPDGRLGELARRYAGAHLPVVPCVFPRLVQIVLLQLVTWADGFQSWNQLIRRYGSDAPGDFGLRCPPAAMELRELGYYDLVACGILPKQARLILKLARDAARWERLRGQPEQLSAQLLAIPGIGPWTVGYLRGGGLGDADALLPGDYHLPHAIAWYLAGEPRGTDQRMLELLVPFAGHRFRIVNLIWQAGVHAPRRGPRTATHHGLQRQRGVSRRGR